MTASHPSHAERLALREAADRSKLIASIDALLVRVPAGYAGWMVSRVRDYKAAADNARKLADKPKAAIRSLRDAEITLSNFYTGK